MKAAEYRAMIAKPKGSKYKNKRLNVDGFTYDSKAEAHYGELLRIREKAGEVSNIERQKPFQLIAVNGESIGSYKADFVFWDKLVNRQRVVDVKGIRTPVFSLKKKLVEAAYRVTIECVKVK